MAEEYGVGGMDTCTAESLHYSPENYHNIGNQLYLNTKWKFKKKKQIITIL